MFAEGTRQLSAFQIFMKDNIKIVGDGMPGQSRGEVMKELGRRWMVDKSR